MLKNLELQESCACNNPDRTPVVTIEEFTTDQQGTLNLGAREIIFITNGTVRLTLEDGTTRRRLEKGEFVFMPTGSRIAFDAAAGSAMLRVKLVGKLPECHLFRINRVAKHIEKYDGIYALKANERIERFIEDMLGVVGDGMKCEMYMHIEVSRLLFLIHAYYSEEECLKMFSYIISPDVKFSEFVRTNYYKYKTVTQLADAACMTPQQFSNRFRKVFGTTPHKWMSAEKSQLIYRDICQSNKPLKEIAYEHDFSIQSNFIRYCRNTFGMSPGNLRKKMVVR